MPIFFDYEDDCGSLSKFLTSVFSVYSHCRINNTEFFLNITHPIGVYFKNNLKEPQKYNQRFKYLRGETMNTISRFLDWYPKTKVRLVSNLCFLEYNQMKPYFQDFLELIQPTDEIENRIKELTKDFPEVYSSACINSKQEKILNLNEEFVVFYSDNLETKDPLDEIAEFFIINRADKIYHLECCGSCLNYITTLV